MAKNSMHLSIDRDVFDLAKAMNINISNEFERWIKLRACHTQPEVQKDKDYDIEIAKHKELIQRLENEREEKKKLEAQTDKENKILETVIKNVIANNDTGTGWPVIIQERAIGMQSIWFRNFNKRISFNEAQDKIRNKLIENGIDVNV